MGDAPLRRRDLRKPGTERAPYREARLDAGPRNLAPSIRVLALLRAIACMRWLTPRAFARLHALGAALFVALLAATGAASVPTSPARAERALGVRARSLGEVARPQAASPEATTHRATSPAEDARVGAARGNVPLHEWIERGPDAEDDESKPARTTAYDGEKALRALLAGRPTTGPPDAIDPTKSLAASNGGTMEAPITWLFHPESFAPLAKVVNGERYGIVTDHLGTPRAMFDASGDQIWAADIDTYGELRNVRGEKAACPFRWPGQYEDAETGLYYNRLRYYDPAGQYVSRDPIGLFGGLHVHAYVGNPTESIDPLGLAGCVPEDETVTLYHGSVDNYSGIQAGGLDPARTPTWVTTDLGAAQNAIGPGRVLSSGQGADAGIITSVVSKSAFEDLQKSGEISAQRGWPGFGGGQSLTEHVLRSPEAVNVFNAGIVR
jgi:RHS repeat-associated protein